MDELNWSLDDIEHDHGQRRSQHHRKLRSALRRALSDRVFRIVDYSQKYYASQQKEASAASSATHASMSHQSIENIAETKKILSI